MKLNRVCVEMQPSLTEMLITLIANAAKSESDKSWQKGSKATDTE